MGQRRGPSNRTGEAGRSQILERFTVDYVKRLDIVLETMIASG